VFDMALAPASSGASLYNAAKWNPVLWRRLALGEDIWFSCARLLSSAGELALEASLEIDGVAEAIMRW